MIVDVRLRGPSDRVADDVPVEGVLVVLPLNAFEPVSGERWSLVSSVGR